jgi:hypothetical protein
MTHYGIRNAFGTIMTACSTGRALVKADYAFTCGPAALMMAMHGLNRDYQPSREEEINLWREATTIFMTRDTAAATL